MESFTAGNFYQVRGKWGKIRPQCSLPGLPPMKLLLSLLFVLLVPALFGAVSPTPPRFDWAANEAQFLPTGRLAVLPEQDLPHPFSIEIHRGVRRLPEEESRHARSAIDQAVMPRPGCGRRTDLAVSLARLLPPDEALLAEGLYHFDAGRFRQAASILQRVAATYPASPQVANAAYWLAECSLALRERDRAIGQLRGLLDEWPGHPVAAYARYTLAWLAMEDGDLAAAADQLDTALAGPQTALAPSLHLWRLAVAIAGDDLATALESADALLASGPETWQVSVRRILSEILYHSGRYQESLDLIAQEEEPALRLTAGWCRLQIGDEQAAVATFDPLLVNAADPLIALGATLGLFQTAMRSGDLTAAAALLESAPMENGGGHLLAARLELAQAQLKTGRVEEAMAGFQAILDAAPASSEASRTRLALARALFAANEYTDAAEALRYLVTQAAGLDSDEAAEARFLLARSLHLLGDLEGAEASYRELRAVAGDSPWARQALFFEAALYTSQRRLLEAIPLLEAVPADDPNWTVAMEELGKAYLTVGNTARAQAVFAQIVTGADPAARSDALFLLAETAFQNGDLTAAYDYYRQVTETHPDGDRLRRTMMRMAEILSQRGDYRGSTTLLKSVAARFSDHPVAEQAQLAIGVNEWRAGRIDSAITTLSRFATRFPNSPYLGEALYRLGTAYRQGGQAEEAVHAFSQAVAAGGTGGPAVAAQLAEAFAYADTGQAEAAFDALERIFRDHGNDPQTLLDAVEWLRTTGNPDYCAHALNEMESRLQSSHWLAEVELTRGMLHEKEAATDEAIACYAKLLRSYPAEAATRTARLRMAHLYVANREYFLASQVLKRILEDPTDREHEAEARLLLGEVYESLDFADRALETYLPLVDEQAPQPYHGQAALRIGRLLLELGHADRAYPFFIEAGNSNELAVVETLPYYRGRALVEMGRYGEGIHELEGFLNGMPADTSLEIQAYLTIAKAYLQQGDRAAALRVLARANTLAEGTPFATTVRELRMGLVETAIEDDGPRGEPRAAGGASAPPTAPAPVGDATPVRPPPSAP